MELDAELTGTIDETLNGFNKNGKAQGKQEDTIDECSEDFGSLPAIRIL